MCSGSGRRWSFRYVLTNWQQPLPLRKKVRLTVRNLWIRLTTPSMCCGHPGQPGC